MSTAQTLGQYRKDLEVAGFTRDEAMGLVGHVAPIDLDELHTNPAPAPRSIGPDPLRIVVLAGSREEAARWKNDQVIRNRIDSPDRFILVNGKVDSGSLLGLRGPLAVVTLSGFHRLPVEKREEIETAIRRANAMCYRT
ncbi:hypothetical protein KGD82_16425 [Nocardiopsis eucommiae]|uniref:Uncharacterized protein n=1 Tax=Nocardiopsis eucommiae TaxID=2831970 RepID=A0A975L897_9ACTN|nr:hypothetical protein KGD82_16425 [Nocardiopsis eucommiae]